MTDCALKRWLAEGTPGYWHKPLKLEDLDTSRWPSCPVHSGVMHPAPGRGINYVCHGWDGEGCQECRNGPWHPGSLPEDFYRLGPYAITSRYRSTWSVDPADLMHHDGLPAVEPGGGIRAAD